ncbi:GNAT family N-acetyltransferase [Rhizobium rhizogenes]|uniref:Acetyltransferase n=1 Tax=Rhizobium rhizogenes (strain K84 / ATCC BAA-868) TaxID=311403 RepID=B9JQI7_RHIR8|nr:acetyltransferase [Rhizobium rhizogenes K84]
MADPIIVVTRAPDRQTIEAIASGLNSFNDEVTGIDDRLPLAVFAKDPVNGNLIGGVTGRTSLLFLDVFYIARNHRGLGLGRRILQSAEEEGRRRGCRRGFSIQSASRLRASTNAMAGEFSVKYPAIHREQAGYS